MGKKKFKNFESEIKKIIFRFLNRQDYDVFIFGSRAVSKADTFSDYDIGVLGKQPVPLHLLSKIEEALEESDIPFCIDIVDFFRVSSNFREVAMSNIRKL